jgi:heme/copper-type cytochrome/quinol oxidase subunit 2
MRLIVLEFCGAIAVLVFLAMLAAIARHRRQCGSQTEQPGALTEYLWATIPWLMIISCAIPAVHLVASACESCDVAAVTSNLGPASQAFLSKTAVVIDEQKREQRQ